MGGSPPGWITAPDFSASNLLSARHLNIIQHDIALLHGHNYAPPLMFPGMLYQTGGDASIGQEFWRGVIEHRYDNLRLSFAVKAQDDPTNGNNTASGWVTVSPQTGSTATSVVASATDNSSAWSFAPSTIDLSSFNLTTGCAYIFSACVVRSAGGGGNVEARLDFLYETAGSTGFTTQPTITAGCIGSASDVDKWSDGLGWLVDRIGLINQSFTFMEAQTGDTQPETHILSYGYLKHTGSLLNYRWGQRSLDPNFGLGDSSVSLLANGSVIDSTTCDATNATWRFTTGSYDLTNAGITAGEFYEIDIRAQNQTSNGAQAEVRLEYAYESDIPAPSGWNTPSDFSHGETTPAPTFQNISDNITTLHDERRDIIWPVRTTFLANGGGTAVHPSENSFGGISIIHRAPWLHHLGAGQIEFGNNSVNFSDPDEDNPGSTWGVINLMSITWLPNGAVYTVTGDDLEACYESFSSTRGG